MTYKVIMLKKDQNPKTKEIEINEYVSTGIPSVELGALIIKEFHGRFGRFIHKIYLEPEDVPMETVIKALDSLREYIS
jgi:hypothetical protein